MHAQAHERPPADKAQHVEADQDSRRHSHYAASTSQSGTPVHQESYNKRCSPFLWHALRQVQDYAGL